VIYHCVAAMKLLAGVVSVPQTVQGCGSISPDAMICHANGVTHSVLVAIPICREMAAAAEVVLCCPASCLWDEVVGTKNHLYLCIPQGF